MRAARIISLGATIAALSGCGRDDADPARYALQASAGAYHDGSGRPGVAMLMTLRDGTGAGPGEAWTGELSDQSGAWRGSAVYADSTAGSYVATWWADVPLTDGEYHLALEAREGSLRADAVVSEAPLLATPALSLAADGRALEWGPVPGAAVYECRITSASGAVRSTVTHDTCCPLVDLPDDGHAASVLAYSADLALLSADLHQRPALPQRFDVAEGRLAFVTEGSAAVAVVAVAGGALDYGLGARTLATWVAIRNLDGTPTTTSWDVAITGPGIPATSPLAFTYVASFSERLVWTYEQPATPGGRAPARPSLTTRVARGSKLSQGRSEEHEG